MHILYESLGTPLPTPEEMAVWDKAAITECHIPEALLMENAAREAFHVIAPMLLPASRVLVIMGGGNNGGDGAALARHLVDAGHQVLVCHTKPLEQLSPTVGQHALMARKAGVPFVPLVLTDAGLAAPPERLAVARSPHMVVDALLGTGFLGKLRERELEIIRHSNRLGESVPVVALDVPSGLDAATGLPRSEAVRACCTVTFEATKTGLIFPHAKPFTGTVHERRIGIPRVVRDQNRPSFYRLAPGTTAWPTDSPEMHKGQAGRVLIFGGSAGLTGAPALAALGALRAGAGLVTAACPGGLEALVRCGFPELMTLPLGKGEVWNNAILPACLKAIGELPHASALVLGPGIGRSAETLDVVRTLIAEKNRPPLVLDADALCAIAYDEATRSLSPMLEHLRENDCITPHPGEAARILGTNVADIQAARVASATALAAATRATVVLKGAATLIVRGNSPVVIAPFAAPALATGGSGDVLGGVIAAFLAGGRGVRPAPPEVAFTAACLGAYCHGKAGEMLGEAFPNRGVLAREIADAIPRIVRT